MSNETDQTTEGKKLPAPPSSVYTTGSPNRTLLQRMRAFSEEVLMEAAKQEMREKFPDDCGPRARKKEVSGLRRLGRSLFVTAFRVTPGPLRKLATRILFRDSAQRWPPSEPLGPGDR